MSEQRLPAEYARRPCGLFIEIAACNIDTEHQECHTAFDGDIQDLKLLDFAPIIVREPEPGRFLLVNEEDRCRLHKQLAVDKKWILALDENDPNVVIHSPIVARERESGRRAGRQSRFADRSTANARAAGRCR
jgi:hypothetical protein